MWLTGVGFFLLRLMGGLAYIQRLKHQKNRPLGDYWQAKMRTITQRLQLRRPVRLLESTLVNVPMVLGYFKPVILLPLGAVNSLTVQEVEAVLAHELAHVQRNDYLVNIVLSLIEVLFYYHPAVWFISANVRNERENCADDIAVRLCGNSLTYAKALVSLQELHPTVPAFAMPFSRSKNQLLHRIQRILQQPQTRSNIRERLLATGMLLVALLLLSVSANGTSEGKTKLRDFSLLSAKKIELDIEPADLEPLLMTTTDTIPPRTTTRSSSSQRIVTDRNGQEVEIEIEDEQLTKLRIDGRLIPPAEYEQHEELIARIRQDIPRPPAPPIPPRPGAVPSPPAPPAPPAPPVPSGIPAPPVPPSPPELTDGTRIKIITEDGQSQIISIGGAGEEIMELNIEDDAIFLNGERIDDVDEIYLIEGEDQDLSWTDGEDFNWDEKAFKIEGFDDLDSLLKFGDSFSFEILEPTDPTDPTAYAYTYENLPSPVELRRSIRAVQSQLRSAQRAREEIIREYQQELSEEQQEQLRAHRAKLLRRNERIQGELDERMAELEQLRARAKDTYQKAERATREARKEVRRQREVQMEELKQHLLEDGLIRRPDDSFSFRLDLKKLRVNGKRQSADLHQKYLRLFRGDGQGDHSFSISIEQRK